MATEKATARPALESSADTHLDEAKLSAAVANEQGEVFVLQWLSKLEASLFSLEQSDLLQAQSTLETSLRTLVCTVDLTSSVEAAAAALASPPPATTPRPGRPSRQLIARCLVLLFERGETRSLYDMVQQLSLVAGEDRKGRLHPDNQSRVAALYVAGELFRAHGQNVMSQFIALLTLCQRIFKNVGHSVIVRYHALLCLSKVLKTGAKSLNEQSAKELLKSLRQAMTDRAGAVARGGAECLLVILEDTQYLSVRSEIESLLAVCFRALDSADFVTMRVISRFSAALLAHTQRESTVPLPPAPKKKPKKKREGQQDDSSDDNAGPSTPGGADGTGSGRSLMPASVMLSQLSYAFLRTATTKRGRGALLAVFASLLQQLGAQWVQTHYDVLIANLMDEIPNHYRGTSSRAEVLSVRSGVALILRRVVGERMLDETAQVGAIQEICNMFLRRFPVLTPGQHPPSKYSLVLAFNETSGLLGQLGSAPPQVLDALQPPLLRCLAHPSHSVQISAAWCLRQLCTINPLHLSPLLDSVLAELKRDVSALQSAGDRGGADLPKRATGRARGLAALLSIIPQRPLYVSFDISTSVMNMAIKLLKGSAEHSLAISAIEIQVSWTLIGALMALGPNFVRDHLHQLLNMWRSALPKIADTAATRSDAEWGFLLHVRECTLGSILAFLLHNGSSLVTLDTARRLIVLLSNSLSFVNQFSVQHPTLAQEQVPGTERASLTLLDREQMVRRRVMQCFSRLANSPALETLQESLVSAAVQAFAEPERYIGSAAQAAIAASAGNFSSIWHLSDGYAYGVTSMMQDGACSVSRTADNADAAAPDLLNRDAVELQLDALQRRPILGAPEHDPIVLYASLYDADAVDDNLPPTPVPPPTAAVDAALELFAALIPYQKRETQIATFERLLSYSRSARLERNPARRMAVQANACTAVLGALRTAMQVNFGRAPGGFNNERVTTAVRELLLETLLQGDLSLRAAASEAFGRLAAISGSQAMSSQVQMLVDQVVSNRDPDARAGCAMAFGAVYKEVGGLGAGPLTKTVVDILMSLANDPHPTVHFTALEALRMVVDAASLSYSAYVSSTLGMLVKLYMLHTHEPEGGSVGSANLRADLPANQVICRVINALIGVLGPDLEEATKVRSLILILLNELSMDSADDGVVVESTKAMQHLTLFAAQHIDLAAWMSSLQRRLKSDNRPLKVAAIHGFYQLIQRNALLVTKVCGNALVEEFFALLDGDTDTDGVRQVLRNWLRQTADLSPNGWIDLCQRVSRSTNTAKEGNAVRSQSARPQLARHTAALQDEEAAAIDLGDDGGRSAGKAQSRWRTQLFALECLHEVFSTARRAGRLEHFATPRQSSQLSSRVGDLIRMAFTASTALNAEIRLEGLTILRDVVDNLKQARDPDFEDALLLEQHQAPIAAALTPAFLADSTPEVLARAVQVCAVFVGSGVVREMDKLGRILKLLTRALERCLQADMTSMGDVESLSPNAAATLKIAVFAAWAQLQVASVKQPYLVDILRPHVAQLSSMWVRCLAEYAHLRADPEGTGMALAPVVNQIFDTPYAGLIRAVLVPHHQRAWPTILHALAVSMGKQDRCILTAMRGEEAKRKADCEDDVDDSSNDISSEPVMYFYPLYGLAFEALATGSGSSRETQGVRTTMLALRYLCDGRYAGSVLLQKDLFDELINLCYRIVMTEPASVQIRVVEMTAAFVQSYGARLQDQDDVNDGRVGSLLPFTKMTSCLQLVMFTMQLARSRSTAAAASSASAAASKTDERAALIRAAYTAFCGIVPYYSRAQREHLYAAGFHAYAELLRDEANEGDLVAPTLASLKELCQASMSVYGDALARCVHGFLSANLNILDSMRTRAGPVAVNKTKNALLATVVILTSLPHDVSVSQAVLEQYCYLLSQKLHPRHGDEAGLTIGLTAINCLKTLLLTASRRADAALTAVHPAIAFCIGQTLTSMIELLLSFKHAPHFDTSSIRLLEEAMKTLSGYVGVGQHDEEQRTRLIAVIVPSLALYIDTGGPGALPDEADEDADKLHAQLHRLAVHQTLALARQYPPSFRTVVGLLSSSERARVEAGVRLAVGLAEERERSDVPFRSEAKKIELKSFG